MPLDVKQWTNRIICGDACEVLRQLPGDSIDCVVTSPPYWRLRDYGVAGQLGLESTFTEYIEQLCRVFDEVRRVLKPTGTCWVNLGDTYSSGHNLSRGFNQRYGYRIGTKQSATRTRNETALPDKCLLQLPARFALAMTERGWILRNEIIWHKPNALPASVRDRFTVDFEKLFFFVKSKHYYFDQDRVREPYQSASVERMKRGVSKSHKNLNVPGQTTQGMHKARAAGQEPKVNPLGRNKRCVWSIPTQSYKESHFAVYPQHLIDTPITAGCPKGGIVLDPFIGSGTTAIVAKRLERQFVGIELNGAYIRLAKKRLVSTVFD